MRLARLLSSLPVAAILTLILILLIFGGPANADTPTAPSTAVGDFMSAGDFTTCAAQTSMNPNDCDVLVALYNATDGPNWSYRPGWLQDDDPCSWTGITCIGDRVSKIDISGNGLSGTLPAELGNLAWLDLLELSYNHLTGEIPDSLGNLPLLVNMSLSYNDLTGEIPESLSNLPRLVSLLLSNNELTGTIPSALVDIHTLGDLRLNGNELSGSIPPELGNIDRLWVLELNDNHLSGAIPGNLANTGIGYLDLSDNDLTGTIPTELLNSESLLRFWAANNELEGPIPVGLAATPSLRELDLSGNRFTGTIPIELGQAPRLEALDLSGNMLTGSIPSQLGNLVSLRDLNLGKNALSGTIPSELTNLVNLRAGHYSNVSFSYNMLTATDPELVSFLSTYDPYWSLTQTLPPAGVTATTLSRHSIQIDWTMITYTGDGGYYEIGYSETPAGPYTVLATTANKYATQYIADGLTPDTAYYFVVRSHTLAHDTQQNALWSNYSAEVSATTLDALYMPAVMQ